MEKEIDTAFRSFSLKVLTSPRSWKFIFEYAQIITTQGLFALGLVLFFALFPNAFPIKIQISLNQTDKRVLQSSSSILISTIQEFIFQACPHQTLTEKSWVLGRIWKEGVLGGKVLLGPRPSLYFPSANTTFAWVNILECLLTLPSLNLKKVSFFNFVF